jgi:hypothetical protein
MSSGNSGIACNELELLDRQPVLRQTSPSASLPMHVVVGHCVPRITCNQAALSGLKADRGAWVM